MKQTGKVDKIKKKKPNGEKSNKSNNNFIKRVNTH